MARAAIRWLNFNWIGRIDERSVVHISACEGRLGWEGGFWGHHVILRHRGHAPIFVKNIRPHGDEGGGGGVEFLLEVDWPSRLDVVTDITVLEPPEQESIV